MTLWQLDPIDDENFASMVEKGFFKIPEHLRNEIDNVALTYADLPSETQLLGKGMQVDQAYELLGLYEGVPLIERGAFYGNILPDRITIFKFPCQIAAKEEGRSLEEIVHDTVWHEYAHHFGWNDDEIHLREENGTNHSI